MTVNINRLLVNILTIKTEGGDTGLCKHRSTKHGCKSKDDWSITWL